MSETFELVDLVAAANESAGNGPVWTFTGSDLNLNLITFDGGHGVPSHQNDEVDVLLVVVAGEGRLQVDDRSYALRAGQACVIPKGATRSIHCIAGRFTYLTCHRRRQGLWPR
jgi:quercetin dioxygenase-like cupin family protein